MTASLALLGACGDKDFPNVVAVTPLVATNITVDSASDGQTAVVGTALANPIVVRVTDQNGNALAGATVTFTVIAGGGSVSANSAVTGADGRASVTWTIGLVAGANALQASIASGASVTITATGIPAAFANLTLVSGDNQSIPVNTTSQPMVVKAVDANGNGISGATVTWTTTNVGGTLSATTTTTDASGNASVTLTAGPNAGPYSVTATSGTSSIVFNGTATIP
ncbi:MAG TPA: Ig-like domain-containing protein [Gemmatimonadaceae bacterium]